MAKKTYEFLLQDGSTRREIATNETIATHNCFDYFSLDLKITFAYFQSIIVSCKEIIK